MVMCGYVTESCTACFFSFSAFSSVSTHFLRPASDSGMALVFLFRACGFYTAGDRSNFGELRVHDDAGGGAVGELARVSGRDGAAFDRRLDLGDALERRVRADAFVVLRRDLLDPTFPRLLVGFLHSHRQRKDLRVESAG